MSIVVTSPSATGRRGRVLVPVMNQRESQTGRHGLYVWQGAGTCNGPEGESDRGTCRLKGGVGCWYLHWTRGRVRQGEMSSYRRGRVLIPAMDQRESQTGRDVVL